MMGRMHRSRLGKPANVVKVLPPEELAVRVQELSEEQLSEFHEAFLLFDKNKDGMISTTELGSVMRTLGENPTEAELVQIISEMDTEGSGTINLQAFIYLMTSKFFQCDFEHELLTAFKVFDRDGNGLVNVGEILIAVTQLREKFTAAEVAQMLQEADIDGDGNINYEEFARAMTF